MEFAGVAGEAVEKEFKKCMPTPIQPPQHTTKNPPVFSLGRGQERRREESFDSLDCLTFY